MPLDHAATLARTLDGGRLSIEDGLTLYSQAPTESLLLAAHQAREQKTDGQRVTYLIDRNINYTNVCITDCKFCEFYRPVGHAQAYVLTRPILWKKMEELRQAGGTRVLLQGGHHPDLPLEWYEELLRDLRADFPTIERDAFSPSEIEHMALVSGESLETVMRRLKAAGLDGVPGGGGEILDDEIRQRVSPKKTTTATWLRVMEIAHQEGLYTSASQVFGFGEEIVHRLRALLRLRDQQDRSLARFGLGFMAFVSWPLQYESRFGDVFGGIKGMKLGATNEEYLRHAAFCRLFLDNIPHHQASWPTMGLSVAAQALRGGCDDMGGTMMEENVVSQAGSVHSCVTEDEVQKTIKAAGFLPVKRDSWYRLLTPSPLAP
ncbi:MAG TPA: CofH family radical SAM protein [Planctomycetota bacterium]|nr:CofH family radical SAM protein [Planctomycetota bacterium]